MKLQSLAVACAALIALSISGAAFASESLVVKLQSPVAAKTKFIAGGTMIVCEADACTAANLMSQTYGLTTCKVIAKTAGAVTAFTAGGRAFNGDQLTACNAAALSNTQVAKR